MKRTVILLLDSFGIGSSDDAEQFTGTLASSTMRELIRSLISLSYVLMVRLIMVVKVLCIFQI